MTGLYYINNWGIWPSWYEGYEGVIDILLACRMGQSGV